MTQPTSTGLDQTRPPAAARPVNRSPSRCIGPGDGPGPGARPGRAAQAHEETTDAHPDHTAVLAAALAAGSAVAVPGAAQAATTRWRVTATASTTQITLGQTVKVRGHVQKSGAGKKIVLQQRCSSTTSWKSTGNALVRSDGTYTLKDTPTRNHKRWYRVVMAADSHHRRGVSDTMPVDVYQWLTLTASYLSVNTDSLYKVSSLNINGTSYPSSLEAETWSPGGPATQSVEFNVNHKCLRFRGRFGLSDDSETGAQAEVQADADGAPWFDQTFALGESTPNEFTFETPPLKLRFQTQSTIDGVVGLGGVATPQVYCEQ